MRGAEEKWEAVGGISGLQEGIATAIEVLKNDGRSVTWDYSLVH
jgi:hypothetical protein